MPRKNLILCRNSRGGIPQKSRCWLSLDTETIARKASDSGLAVHRVTPPELCRLNTAMFPESVVFSATSCFPSYRAGFAAALQWAEGNGARLVPELVHYQAYEDKVLGALHAAARGCRMPPFYLVQSRADIAAALTHCGCPCVWKLPQGAGSRWVRIVRDIRDAQRLARKWLRSPEWGNDRPASPPSRLWNKLFGYYPGWGCGTILCQAYIPSPGYDWKVLIWNEKATALRRGNRHLDFRASGSGRFDVVDCPAAVLSEALDAYHKLKLPWGSFDLIEGPDGPRMIEWQAVHFGTLTTECSNSHYRRENNGWVKFPNPIRMEEEIADTLCRAAREER